MSDEVKLYVSHINELSEFNSYMPGYHLSDEEGMEEACYITLPKADADTFFQLERDYRAWQDRLKPLYQESRRKLDEARREKKEREELARLKAKYGQ